MFVFTSGGSLTAFLQSRLRFTLGALLPCLLLAAKPVAAAQDCQLYPLALPAAVVTNASPGAILPDIFQGAQPGSFGWLAWAGSPSQPTLVASLTPPGNSSTYVNPDHSTDHQVSVGDWVKSKPGVSDSKPVRDALEALKQIDITVPVWNATRGQGDQAAYRVSAFARVRLLGYQLPGQNRISARFLGYVNCPDQNLPPIVSAGPDLNVTLSAVVVLNGSVSDDGLPLGGAPAQTWSVISGPGQVIFDNIHAATATATFSVAGTYVLRLTATDSELTASDEVVILVNRENHPPVAYGQGITNDEDNAVIILLQATDPDGDVLTYFVDGQPPHGTVSMLGTNVVRYTPAPDYSGPDEFTFHAHDGALDSAVATVTITNRPVNDAPVADPVVAATEEDVPVTIPLSGSDLEGSSLDYSIVVPPAHGSLGGTGHLRLYSPAANFHGNDHFSYVVADGALTSLVATVSITVTSINDRPIVLAGPDQLLASMAVVAQLQGAIDDVEFAEGQPLTTNWTVVSGPGTVTFGNPQLAETTAAFSAPGVYALQLAAEDGFFLAADEVIITVNQPPQVQAGWDATNTFATLLNLTGAAADPDGIPTNGTLVVTWEKLDGPGEVTFGDSHVTNTTASFSQSGPYTLRLTATDSAASVADDVFVLVNKPPRVDAGSDQTNNSLHVLLVGTVSDDNVPAGVPVTSIWSKVSGPGDVTFANAVARQTAADFSLPGVYVLRLTATDSINSASDDLIVDLNSPPLAVNDSYDTGEDSLLTVNSPGVLANDVDADGDVLTALLVTGPEHGGVDLNPDGSFVYVPFDNYHGSDSFTYRISDGAIESAPAVVSIEVASVNDVPTALNDAYSVSAGVTVTVGAPGLLANDHDLDGDTLAAVLVNQPGHGTVNLNANGSFTYTPAAGYQGSDSFTYSASDGSASSLPATVNLQVQGSVTNQPPVVSAGPDRTVPLQTYIQLNGVVLDDGQPAGTPLAVTWEQVGGLTGSAFLIETNIAVTRLFVYFPGTYIFRLTASDSVFTVSDEMTVTSVELLPPEVNHPPVVDPGPPGLLQSPTNTVVIHGHIFDDGLPTNGTLSFTWSVCYEFGGTATLSGTDTLNPTLTVTAPGWYAVCLEANDGEFIVSSGVDVLVEETAPIDQPPVVDAGPDQIIPLPANQATLTSVVTDDGPADHLFYFWQQMSGPVPVVFSPHAFLDTVTITMPKPGTYGFRLLVYDDFSVSWDETFVTLTNVHLPTVSNGSYWTFEDRAVKLYLQGTDDLGHPLTYHLVNPPRHGQVIGNLDVDPPHSYYFPDRDYFGIDTFTYAANDGFMNSQPGTVTVEVRPSDDDTFLAIRAPGDGAVLAAGQGIPIQLEVLDVDGQIDPISLRADEVELVRFTSPPYTFTWGGASLGTHVLTAVATDQFGQTRVARPVTVTVISAETGPLVDAGPDQLIVLPGTAGLAASLRLPASQPSATTNVSWSKIGGVGNVTFSAGNALATSATFSDPGSYVLQVQVVTANATVTDAVAVEVLPAAAAHVTAVRSSRGRDFWLTYLNNAGASRLSLIVASDRDATGEVEFYDPKLQARRSVLFNVRSNSSISIPWKLLADSQLDLSDAIRSNGVHLTASADVSVYGLTAIGASADGFLVLPRGMLGTNYLVLTYPNTRSPNSPNFPSPGTQFAIVGTETNTLVQIAPRIATGSRPAGVPYTITLQKGETYRLINRTTMLGDLSGSEITSDKPVAVFSGHTAAYVPDLVLFADHLAEQLPPVNTWGRQFVTMPSAERKGGDTFRVLASANDTAVSVNGKVVSHLQRGEVYQSILEGPQSIVTTKPALVAQFAHGTLYDGAPSDPFFALVPATDQYGAGYVLATPVEFDDWTGQFMNWFVFGSHVNLVVPTPSLGAVRVDGAPVGNLPVTPIGQSGFVGLQLPVTEATHTFSGSAPFGLLMYGWGIDESYAYVGGLYSETLESGTSISLEQLTSSARVGDEKFVIARARDGRGQPLSDLEITFAVAGTHAVAGRVRTDPFGAATFA